MNWNDQMKKWEKNVDEKTRYLRGSTKKDFIPTVEMKKEKNSENEESKRRKTKNKYKIMLFYINEIMTRKLNACPDT